MKEGWKRRWTCLIDDACLDHGLHGVVQQVQDSVYPGELIVGYGTHCLRVRDIRLRPDVDCRVSQTVPSLFPLSRSGEGLKGGVKHCPPTW